MQPICRRKAVASAGRKGGGRQKQRHALFPLSSSNLSLSHQIRNPLDQPVKRHQRES